ncbi:MAG TPA: T9SS type A sorting domain-containing protein, partial [Bacteroidetes bacterium]|nr:T9SS type A sorting domain-containing protein [Bacteroidota bacterium]
GSKAVLLLGATDEYDPGLDQPKPEPPVSDYLSVDFPHEDWGAPSGSSFMVDARFAHDNLSETAKVWEVRVRTDQVGETVVLSFPLSDALPGEYPVTLVDLQSGDLHDAVNDGDHAFTAENVESYFLLVIGAASAPEEFSLLAPADGSVIGNLSVMMSWEAAVDPEGDDITYTLYLGTEPIDPEAPPEPLAAGLTSTAFTFEGEDETAYHWAVRAEDALGFRTWCSPVEFTFTLSAPNPPSDFHLLSPLDEDSLEVGSTGGVVILEWEASIDPDPDGDVLYEVFLDVYDEAGGNDFFSAAGLSFPTREINLPDSMGIETGSELLEVWWWVRAVSQEDTVESEEYWVFYLLPSLGLAENTAPIPSQWAIRSLYPNPFNPALNITLTVPRPGDATLRIFDLLGREIYRKHLPNLQPGYHHAVWRPEGPTGVYFLRVTSSSGFQTVRKVIYLK